MYEIECEKIKEALQDCQRPLIIAIDGRCASGKSTFGTILQEGLDANCLRMDDFFLQPYQRTQERYDTPGENVDHERVEEAILAWKNTAMFRYQIFDCQTMDFGGFHEEEHKEILIVEGSYSMHAELLPYYDYKIFFTVDMEERLRRITVRNGEEKRKMFAEKWIPLEEKYFNAFQIAQKADMIINTGITEEKDA